MPGKIVLVTKSKKTGITKNEDELVKGKVLVYLDDKGKDGKQLKMMCDPKNLKVLGFWD